MNARMDIIEIIEKTACEDPERLALKSSSIGKGITYRELNAYSASIYACLKEKSIGRENNIVAVLPRDWHSIVAAIAVWKVGACITLVENTYAKERIEFIKRDSKAALVIDYEKFMEMLEHEPLYGHEIPDEHDACFIVYTSGSTGNPKGVLHEYGKVGMAIEALRANAKPTSDGSFFAMVAPLNFLASYLTIFYIYALGKCAYILSYEVVKNPPVLADVLLTERINEIFMTPTFLKAYRKASPYLVNFFMGGESCNNTFIDGLNLINCYASSESGMPAATYVLTEREEKVPAGKSIPGDLLMILDDAGMPVAEGEIGEICIRNCYTRGYLNLPEKNAETFRNSICHMGDMGYIREDGNLMFCGRKDDMIKINGNRVEPGEIEEVLKRVLHISNAVVKGFVNENRAYLCAYFISDELKNHEVLNDVGTVSAEKIKALIQDYLPYYMIPTYYVLLNQYPVNQNGKLSKKDLQAPDTDDYRSDYAAPENDAEKYFCDCFAAVLQLDRVGVNDDFYLIGGDSLSAAEFMSQSELPGLNIGDLYQFRTPRKLAKYYLETFNKIENIDTENIKALSEPQEIPKTIADSMYEEVHLREDSTMWNLPSLFRLKKGTDPNKLKAAVDRVYRNHPAFSTKAQYNQKGQLCLVYSPDFYQEIQIEYTNEKKFEEVRKTLIRPFETIDSLLYRHGIYVTEDDLYLFVDFYHTIVDGTSIGIVLSQIGDILQDVNYQIPTDYQYLILKEYNMNSKTGVFDKVRQHYSEFYKDFITDPEFVYELKKDFDNGMVTAGLFEDTLSESKHELLTNPFIKDCYGNVFYISMLLLAIASLNKKNYAYLQLVYNGRNSAIKMNSVGMLIKALPVIVLFRNDETLGELFLDVKRQIDYSLGNCDVRLSEVAGFAAETGPFFLYQKDIFNTNQVSFIEEKIPLQSQSRYCDANIEFSVIDNTGSDSIHCSIKYSDLNYKENTIRELYTLFNRYISKSIELDDAEYIRIMDLLEIDSEEKTKNKV